MVLSMFSRNIKVPLITLNTQFVVVQKYIYLIFSFFKPNSKWLATELGLSSLESLHNHLLLWILCCTWVIKQLYMG